VHVPTEDENAAVRVPELLAIELIALEDQAAGCMPACKLLLA
jgi:hypothetical protein